MKMVYKILATAIVLLSISLIAAPASAQYGIGPGAGIGGACGAPVTYGAPQDCMATVSCNIPVTTQVPTITTTTVAKEVPMVVPVQSSRAVTVPRTVIVPETVQVPCVTTAISSTTVPVTVPVQTSVPVCTKVPQVYTVPLGNMGGAAADPSALASLYAGGNIPAGLGQSLMKSMPQGKGPVSNVGLGSAGMAGQKTMPQTGFPGMAGNAGMI